MKIERDFFKSNPDKGMFHNRIIVGTVIPPPQNDTKLINASYNNYYFFYPWLISLDLFKLQSLYAALSDTRQSL